MAESDIANYAIRHPKKVTVEETCMIYRSIAELPILDDGGILSIDDEDSKKVTCYGTFLQRDLEANENRKFTRQYSIKYTPKTNGGDKEYSCAIESPSSLWEMRDILCQAYTVDGCLKALVRNKKEDGKDKQFLEIWSQHRLVKNVNLTSLDKHEKVYGKGPLSSFVWSDDGRKILYIAEKKKTSSFSYFEKLSEAQKEKPSTSIGDKFLHEEEWGEQLIGQSQPVIAVLDTEKGEVTIVNGVPDDLSPGQACWGPDGSIVFIGWKNNPFRLGLVYCENRESAIYQLKIGDRGNECLQLSKEGCAVNAPRVSPGKDKLVFLEREAGGPHRGCERLMIYSFADGSCGTLYDIVNQNPFEGGLNIGIFAHGLPRRCWVEGGRHSHVILDTFCGVSKSIVSISLETKKMSLLGILMEESCQYLLDVYKGFALFTSSATNCMPELCLVRINEEDLNQDDSTFNGVLITVDDPLRSKDKVLSSIASDLQTRLTQTIVTYTLSEHGKFESVLLRPNVDSADKRPLIAWVHGGPHSVFPASFMLYPTAFCYQGYTVLLVNYRGSTGFGEASLKSLFGNVGDQDVKDCHQIIENVVATYDIDRSNIILFGGSHGGFLTTHLIGQYPEYFCTAAVRNPVINISSMVDGSDIPDWCFVESGFGNGDISVHSSDRCKKMFECSPIAHIEKIKAPLLILLGENDVRVPPFQGKHFYRMLKCLGKKTKLLCYPDNNHPLAKTEAEADVFINVSKWFRENMK